MKMFGDDPRTRRAKIQLAAGVGALGAYLATATLAGYGAARLLHIPRFASTVVAAFTPAGIAAVGLLVDYRNTTEEKPWGF
jgi:hypothetical protein